MQGVGRRAKSSDSQQINSVKKNAVNAMCREETHNYFDFLPIKSKYNKYGHELRSRALS
jgi:hypothetical protein